MHNRAWWRSRGHPDIDELAIGAVRAETSSAVNVAAFGLNLERFLWAGCTSPAELSPELDARIASPASVGRPENMLARAMFLGRGYGRRFRNNERLYRPLKLVPLHLHIIDVFDKRTNLVIERQKGPVCDQ